MFRIKKPRKEELDKMNLTKNGVPAKSYQDCTHVIITRDWLYPIGSYEYDYRKDMIESTEGLGFFVVDKNVLLKGLSSNKCEMWHLP